MDEFERLLREHVKTLERFVRYKVSNRFDAEDIIQDVCLNAFSKFGTLKNKASFKAWIISIAKNRCNDYYRKKAENMELSIDVLAESNFTVGRCGLTERSTVSDTIDKLGDKEKQILYLYFYKDLCQEDISKRLNIPLGTVKSRLHYAKQKFKEKYPYQPGMKGPIIMKKFPDTMPEYKIKKIEALAFSVVFEELPNWFIIPRVGEEVTWASYDKPTGRIKEKVHSKAESSVIIHGIEGVEIITESESYGGEYTETSPHLYYAQLTDTHCRWLGECYTDRNGAKRLLTFLDGDDFVSEWGYGEDNCGSETHLIPRSKIKRNGDDISVLENKDVIDIVGRYNVEINGMEYDAVCIMENFGNGALTEQYVDKSGKTVLWRRFNKNDWAYNRYQKSWSEMLPENESVTVNGELYVHWYDCITDYVL